MSPGLENPADGKQRRRTVTDHNSVCQVLANSARLAGPREADSSLSSCNTHFGEHCENLRITHNRSLLSPLKAFLQKMIGDRPTPLHITILLKWLANISTASKLLCCYSV